MKQQTKLFFSAFTLLVAVMGLHVHADPIADAAPQTIILSGNQDTDVWSNSSLVKSTTTNSNFSGFPGSTAWPNPIASTTANSGTSGDMTLNKTANGSGGGPYPASGSLYFGSFGSTPNTFGGSLAVTDTTPISGLQTIVFQLEIAEARTYDLYNHELPTLTYTYNDGTSDVTVSSVAADFSSVLVRSFNGTVEMPSGTESIYINLYALQWDLSGVDGTITNFSISFSGVEHAQVYSMQVDQGDTMVQVVPEPSTYAMILSGAVLLMWFQRRRVRMV